MPGDGHAPHIEHRTHSSAVHAVYALRCAPMVVPATYRAQEPDSTRTSRGRSGVQNGAESTR